MNYTHPKYSKTIISTLTYLLSFCILAFTYSCNPSKPNKVVPISVNDNSEYKEAKTVETIKKQQQFSKWLFIGDSLTAGFGVEIDQSYVSVLQDIITSENLVDSTLLKEPKLINAGVSGDTSAGVLRRLDWLLAEKPDRVFLCIGANDGLRGQPLAALEKNLTKIIKKLKDLHIYVYLMGMKLPPNYGESYTTQFAQVYVNISKNEMIPLYPFLLEGVAGHHQYNQADGIHPTEAGHHKIAKKLSKKLINIGLLQKSIK